MFVPLSNPDITDHERKMVMDVLSTSTLSIGPWVLEFEKRIADYVGVKHAIAVNSGTSGLHLIVRALDIRDGDEVITTPFSFVASSNCLLFERAKPVFVDIDPDTMNIDVKKIEEKITEKTKAILPVHVFGQPTDMEEILKISEKYNLPIIEDACEAIGAEYKGKKAGAMGKAGVFAFYPNKQITTGEGGIIVTNDDELARLCRSMRNQGRGEGNAWLAHERLGFNYRMDELSAALGVAQLDRIDEILSKREAVAQRYNKYFENVNGVIVPYVSPEVKMSWFVYVIRFAEEFDRASIMRSLHEKGIGCRPYFSPIHLQPFYRKEFGFKPGDFPITERVSQTTLAIPFFNNLSDEQALYVVETIKECINNHAD
ncbi:polysaccharide biosynthesis protein [Collibacillus ludicampi]|uniref:Polysaccharide biosynthesis protein n=1 Tax=Collibacillus ludicampi TaxID=2771369 RepID=A0AAV4LCB2_9BACL|nr:DegT/DnrJ/EryC1/StrS family aminotransferase [Collibacillus ludicampi]GIM45487.1 polysaccharide biosynthesis protein [Collibacillus ludicampi]